MLVRELPGTASLAENFPSFCDLPLGRAVKFSARLLLETGLWANIKDQRRINGDLSSHMDLLDLTGDNTIVQIGANDGMRDDPINHILASKDVRSVLVEPSPIAFEALSKLHMERPNTHLVQGAIGSTSGKLPLYVPAVRGKELYSSVWTSRSREQAAGEVKRNLGRRALKNCEVMRISVPIQTAAELLEQCSVAPEDVAVLVCDTEGQDTEIVHSFLDATALPEIIFYEQLHVPEPPAVELKARLDDLGYEIKETAKDVLAVLSS
jgi:FkbM family methyltransferase